MVHEDERPARIPVFGQSLAHPVILPGRDILADVHQIDTLLHGVEDDEQAALVCEAVVCLLAEIVLPYPCGHRMLGTVVRRIGVHVHAYVVVPNDIEERRLDARDEVGQFVLHHAHLLFARMSPDDIPHSHHERRMHQVAAFERVRESAAVVAARAVRDDGEAEILRIVLEVEV